MSLIEIKNLVKRFGKFEALRGINLNLVKGEVAVLMGPNGSGKTTLIKSILGLVIPDSGEIIVGGKKISDDFRYREQIGYMPQIANYPENLKVKELFSIVKDIRGKSSTDDELIEDFGIGNIIEKKFGQLSGGFKQRVTAAIAFLYNPEILILDEPTSSLDPLSNEIMKKKILKEKQNGKLMLVSSHIVSESEEIADRIIYLLDGKVIFNKKLSELKNGDGRVRLGDKIKKHISDYNLHVNNE